jgi:transcriptional regulator with XRE-family HTH domain
MTIGETIKKAREEKGLSQRQLSKMLYINNGTLCLIEKGKQSLNPELVNPLCKALDITPNDLYGFNV